MSNKLKKQTNLEQKIEIKMKNGVPFQICFVTVFFFRCNVQFFLNDLFTSMFLNLIL